MPTLIGKTPHPHSVIAATAIAEKSRDSRRASQTELYHYIPVPLRSPSRNSYKKSRSCTIGSSAHLQAILNLVIRSSF